MAGRQTIGSGDIKPKLDFDFQILLLMAMAENLPQPIAATLDIERGPDIPGEAVFEKGEDAKGSRSVAAHKNAVSRDVLDLHIPEGLEIFHSDGFNIHGR